jgi:hypothetical protein
MTAISLAIVGGFVLWQMPPAGHEARSSTASHATPNGVPDVAPPVGGLTQRASADQWAHVTHDAAQNDARGGLAERDAMEAPTVVETVYLVATAAEAEMLRTLSNPTPARQVVVVESTQERSLLQGLGSSDEIRDQLGLPGIEVFDLRNGAATSCAEAAGLVTAGDFTCS